MKEEEFKRICEILKRNQELGRKFFEIESEILTVLDFKGLFERLVSRIREKLEVPYVWITVIEGSFLSELLKLFESSPLLMDRIGVIGRDEFMALFPGEPEPILVNSGLKPFYGLFPLDRPLPVKSMAVAPLTLDGELVGSLNQADTEAGRFSPDKDTGLLAQLAIKVSLCLSNVTAHERIRMMATTDPLTGLTNRRTMEERLREEFIRAHRYDSPLSVVFLDLDGFKEINDGFGHDAGDECLKFFARELSEMAREVDLVCRFAGDEFVVLLPNTDAVEAEAFMQRVGERFSARELAIGGRGVQVVFSHGIATSRSVEAVSPEALLKHADAALYEMKRGKKRRRSRALPAKAVGSVFRRQAKF